MKIETDHKHPGHVTVILDAAELEELLLERMSRSELLKTGSARYSSLVFYTRDEGHERSVFVEEVRIGFAFNGTVVQ